MDLLAEYEALVAKVDALAGGITTRRREDLACRAGCSACCQVSLSVSPVEAAAVARLFATLPREARERARARALVPIEAVPVVPLAERCVMLEEDGTCAVYAARPLVCRTQGLPLRYPAGLVPAAAVRARAVARGPIKEAIRGGVPSSGSIAAPSPCLPADSHSRGRVGPLSQAGEGTVVLDSGCSSMKKAAGELTWCPLNFTGRAPDGEDVVDAGRVDEILAVVNRRFVAHRDGPAGDPLSRTPLSVLAAGGVSP